VSQLVLICLTFQLNSKKCFFNLFVDFLRGLQNTEENFLRTQRVLYPATRKDLAARTWGVFWFFHAVLVAISSKFDISSSSERAFSFSFDVFVAKLSRKTQVKR